MITFFALLISSLFFINFFFLKKYKTSLKECFYMTSGQLPPPPSPRKIAPRLGLGFFFLGRLRLGSNQTIAPEKICPPVRVRVWLRVSFGVGWQFSSWKIVLELNLHNTVEHNTVEREFLYKMRTKLHIKFT